MKKRGHPFVRLTYLCVLRMRLEAVITSIVQPNKWVSKFIQDQLSLAIIFI